MFEEGLALADFYLSSRCCILYITEADLVAGHGYRKRLVRVRNVSTEVEALGSSISLNLPHPSQPPQALSVKFLSFSRNCAANSFAVFFLLKSGHLQGIIIVEKTQISEQYFPEVQKFTVLDLGMVLLPVASQLEASCLINQLVSASFLLYGICLGDSQFASDPDTPKPPSL